MSSRNLGVDVLRVFSVALVVLSHYGLLGGGLGGTHGVVIFFMISGYCMRYSTQGRTGSEFLQARWWRLMPTFVICVSLTASIEAFNILPERSQSAKSYVANVVCLPFGNVLCDAVSLATSRRPIEYSWVDGVYWSLLVEIRFYLILWLLFYVLKIKRAEIPITVLGLLAASKLPLGLMSKGQDFLIYLPFFSFGMAYRSYCDAEPHAMWALAFSASASIYNAVENASGISMGLSPNNLLGYALCYVIFVVGILVFKDGENSLVNYWGVVSYPLYLIHQDLGLLIMEALKSHASQSDAALLVIAVSLVAASAVQPIAVRLAAALRHR